MKARVLVVIFLKDLYAKSTVGLKVGGRGKLLNSLGQTIPNSFFGGEAAHEKSKIGITAPRVRQPIVFVGPTAITRPLPKNGP
jgi:hypothetical protein